MTPQPAAAPEPSGTRERILHYLEEHSAASAPQLSRAWGLTRADIRYHMNALRAEGLIEPVSPGSQQPAGRGRPTQYFRLSNAAAPDNLPHLCAALIDVFLPQSGNFDEEERLQALAGRLVGDTQPAGSTTQRINQAIGLLIQQAYHARWEARAGGPVIMLRRCPYAAVLPGRPQLCQMDRLLLERLTGLAWHQTSRLNLETGRPAACTFVALRRMEKP